MPPKSCFPITKKQIVFCHTPWCAVHSVLFHFRPALWLMRIKKLILPHRKHRDVLIQTGKQPDLSPLSSSQQLCISSYSNADMLRRGVGNNLRLLQYGFVKPATEHTGFLCEDRVHCWSCFTVEDNVFLEEKKKFHVRYSPCWGTKPHFTIMYTTLCVIFQTDRHSPQDVGF